VYRETAGAAVRFTAKQLGMNGACRHSTLKTPLPVQHHWQREFSFARRGHTLRERTQMTTLRSLNLQQEERWTMMLPPILGEISSEARPEPISPITLKRIAAHGNRRPLPRIATPENQRPGRALVSTPHAERFRRKRANRVARRAAILAQQPDCPRCGRALVLQPVKGEGNRQACDWEIDGQPALICARCKSTLGQEAREERAGVA
jgi:hypothetical protein